MRVSHFFILMAALLLFACSPTKPPQKGELPIRMDLAPAAQIGQTVTRVAVGITKGDFSQNIDLSINGNTAEGVFESLEPGLYAIDVAVYNGQNLIATGQGTGLVKPGETTTVHINLQFVPGGLEVVIGWGLPLENARRVLFLGNSLTYSNGGVETHLQALLEAARPDWRMVFESRSPGGYTLQNHFYDPQTRQAITNGNWDLVILQEQSSRPVTHPQLFYQYADSLNSLIRSNGAQTSFYMTWARGDNPSMYLPLRNAYNYIGAFLDSPVVPAGVAFHNAADLPELPSLFDPDLLHPSIHGTYLVACLMMAKIWNINPIGNPYQPLQIDAHTALALQQLAWNTLQNEYGSLNRIPRLQPQRRAA